MNSKTTSVSSTTVTPLRIAFVQSCWHKMLVDQARLGFLETIDTGSREGQQVDCFDVPGAFELPLKCQQLAQSGNYHYVVAAGLVVDGGIYRHEFVAQAVINGLMQVQLQQQVPVLSLVLTPHHFHEGPEHNMFFHRHLHQKGQEVANVILQMRQLAPTGA